MLLRYSHEEMDQIGPTRSGQPDRSKPVQTNPIGPILFGPPVRTIKRSNHNFWFPIDMKAHKYSLEILSSLISNPANHTSFWLSNKELLTKHWRLVIRSRVCSRIYLCSTSPARLYHYSTFHSACCTCLESLSSLVSQPTNGLLFRLPSREKWLFYWRLRRSPEDAQELKTILWMLHQLAFHLPTWRL